MNMEHNKSHVTIVVDTNIILHGKSLEELPWSKIFGAIPEEILIPYKVIQELDRKKYEHKYCERARKGLKKLTKLIKNEMQSKINARYCLMETSFSPEEFETGLKPNLDDDCILNGIIKYQKESGKQVVLLTGDSSLSLKAPLFSIRVKMLASEYQLEIDDSNQKEIKRLKSQIKELKNKMPTLNICFENKQTKKDISFDYKKRISSDKELQKYRDDLIRKCPSLPYSDDAETTLKKIDKQTLAMGAIIPGISFFVAEEKRKKYNEERETYIKRIDPHIREMQKYDKIHSRSFEFKLLIDNSGTCSASSVSVKLQFPDGFKLIDLDCNEIDKIERPPTPPIIPEQPVSIFGDHKQNNFSPLVTFHRNQLHKKNTRPLVERLNGGGYIFTYLKEKLRHCDCFSMGRLKIFFDSYDTVQSFNVDCELHCDEFPQPEQHKIHFIVNK